MPVWGECAFTFDPDARDYDWLVVYDDLPPVAGERFSDRVEVLACPPGNTLLITTEPSSIKTYGSAYTAQFGHVLTSQEAAFSPIRGASAPTPRSSRSSARDRTTWSRSTRWPRRSPPQAPPRLHGLLGQAPAPHAPPPPVRLHPGAERRPARDGHLRPRRATHRRQGRGPPLTAST